MKSEIELYNCPKCGWTGFFDDVDEDGLCVGHRCPVCATFYEHIYDLLVNKGE
jgi:hypothetical protein